MDFLDRLEGKGQEKRHKKEARAAFNLLTANMVEALEKYTEIDNLYTTLARWRTERARKAYDKAQAAMQMDDWEEAHEHCRRGLLHLELARLHSLTESPADPTPDTTFDTTEESILRLTENLSQFKLVIEYQNQKLDDRTKSKLTGIVQALQDAVENFARGEDDAFYVAEQAILDLTFLASQVVPAESPAIPQTPAEKGKDYANFQAFLSTMGWAINQARSQTHSQTQARGSSQTKKDTATSEARIEELVQKAIDAHIVEDIAQRDNLVNLARSEAAILEKISTKGTRQKEVAKAASENPIPETDHGLSQVEEKTALLRELILPNCPDKAFANTEISALVSSYKKLKAAVENENWAVARATANILENRRREFKTYLKENDLL